MGASYTVDSSDVLVGETIECTASAQDSTGQTTSSSDSVLVENTPPAVTNISITPNTNVYTDSVLTCTATVVDSDGDSTLTYYWYVFSVFAGSGDTIDLSTTSAIPTDTVTCQAIATDPDGGTGTLSETVVVENRPPSQPTVEIAPNPGYSSDPLTCVMTDVSVDQEGATVTYEYEWTLNGNSTTYTTDTIPDTDVFAGDSWTCSVTPFDGMDEGLAGTDSLTVVDPCTTADCLDLGGGFAIDFVVVSAGQFTMGSPT